MLHSTSGQASLKIVMFKTDRSNGSGPSSVKLLACCVRLSVSGVLRFVLPQSLSAPGCFLHIKFAIAQVARYFFSNPIGQFQ